MPIYTISVANSEFRVSNDHETRSLEEVHRLALKGGLEMGLEEVASGKPFFGAEVTILEDSRVVDRFLVSIGTSPLQ